MAKASTPLLSRSGRWLIGGTLLCSLIVLVWAFRDETSTSGVGRRVSGVGKVSLAGSRRSDDGARSDATPPRHPTPDARHPSLAEYGPLLQRNVFRPLVTMADGRGTGRDLALRGVMSRTSTEHRAPSSIQGIEATKSGPISTNDWRGWRFSGIAQLDQRTYALMDQPGKKRSRFVKPGDRLEDAMVLRVGADEVTLREAGTPGADRRNGSSNGGTVVHVHRFDVMAELLRPSRSPSALPRPGTAPGAPTPSGPIPSRPPVATGTPPGYPGAPTQRVVGSSPSSAGPADQERPAVFNLNALGADENGQESRRSRRERRAREGNPFDASSEQPASED